MLSQTKIQELMSKFAQVNVNQIKDKSLRAKAVKLKKKQAGFTLLELLVVVAILAAIAGTATIALQDTDARASAAAHVAMMDELNKGIRTFRVLNKNSLPSNFDSLIEVATDPTAGTALDGDLLGTSVAGSDILAIEDVAVVAINADVKGILADGGIEALQYVALDGDPEGEGTCADMQDLIADRGNAVVAGNIFMTPDGNGCGFSRTLEDTDEVAIWTGGQERLTGQPAATGVVEFDGSNAATATGKAFMAVGLGPASTLFNANDLGGMTSVPVYRHVSETQYNRFIAVFDIGTFDGTGAIDAADQVVLVTIVDGAGDTKEEELGEWDGTRNTI
ncbi:type II secretion system protein [Thiomicrorhabdus heinhorstiae]|uniref:Prepilin-type N-terminal cleavage/methylation domain-containing protein n=1 Tax=Thiomicrorhabdus heinhorstiae TaxID=2748010 RepID=A0ABS0BWM9_9GAMM|nr:prepilin-type N-terminal cleavage/methylation domain-containing protein [Thiomicrorhabdus heinhorstiae]MBF6057389.1 prepilin-type N-terminal cleavage/methylation domain-containing protein [Thiomicrorhabdus heinhorstiae]